jgi:hypothetical protein
MHDSPGLVILQRGENRVKFSKEPVLKCVSDVGLFIFRISTRFALHSPDES